jgi:hypothetical protein
MGSSQSPTAIAAIGPYTANTDEAAPCTDLVP